MAYIKNTWVDQEVERPKTYEMVNNSDGSVTLVDSFGLVSELGTPVNADNMNHIEDGIEDHEERITELEEGGAGMGLPIGSIFQAIRTDIPEGSLRLDGTGFTTGFEGFVENYLKTGKIISKSLEEWQTEYTMTNGNVGFFGYNETTGAFKTPCIQAGTFLAQAVASGEFGSFLNSELASHTHTQAAHTHTRGTMNITGQLTNNSDNNTSVMWDSPISTSGAFTFTDNTGRHANVGVGGAAAKTLNFNAANSWTGETSSAQPTINATGGSDTYPKHIRYPFFVVVSNVAAEPASQADWDNFVGNLDGKVNKSGDTMTGDLSIAKAGNTWQSIKCTNQSAETGVIPAETANGSRLISYDKNNYWYATVQQAIRPTTGDTYIWLAARNASGNIHALDVRAYPDGTGGCYVNNKAITSLSMPSSKYIDLTLGASGTTYTAPANGYYLLSKHATLKAQNIGMTKFGQFWAFEWAPVEKVNLFCWVPVQKGETIAVSYSADGQTNYFRFYYAEGEV